MISVVILISIALPIHSSMRLTVSSGCLLLAQLPPCSLPDCMLLTIHERAVGVSSRIVISSNLPVQLSGFCVSPDSGIVVSVPSVDHPVHMFAIIGCRHRPPGTIMTRIIPPAVVRVVGAIVSAAPEIAEDHRRIGIVRLDNIVIAIEIGVADDLHIPLIVSISANLYRSDILIHIGADHCLYDDQVYTVLCRFDDTQVIHPVVTVEVEIGDLQTGVVEPPFEICQIPGLPEDRSDGIEIEVIADILILGVDSSTLIGKK